MTRRRTREVRATAPPASEPFADDAEHLRDALLALDARLLLLVARVRQAAGGDPGTRGLTITGDEVVDHFERVPGEPLWHGSPVHAGLRPLADEAEERRAALASRTAATLAAGRTPRLVALADRLGLSELDRELVLLALAPELDVRYERLLGWLHDDVERRRPSLQLALDLFADDFATRLRLRERLTDPTTPPRRHGLLAPQPAPGRSSLQQPLALAPGALRWLTGGPPLDPAAARFIARHDPATAPQLAWPPALAARLAALAAAPRGAVDLVGPPGVGRHSFALALAARLARPLYTVDLARAAALAPGDFSELVAAACLAARLDDAPLCWRGADELSAAPHGEHRELLAAALAGVSQLSLWTWSSGPAVDTWPAALRAGLRVELRPPEPARRRALWAAAAPEAAPADLDVVAETFRLTPGQIVAAAAAARGLASSRAASEPALDDLTRGARTHAAPRLGRLAALVTTHARWDDLVLAPARQAQLAELVRRFRHREQVFGAWGFGRRHAEARSLAALFSGPSGTGKTMAAAIVARELGRDLYRVDLSQMVSKYIGETEKHLAQAFDEAELADVALFFDEADALFGKRSAVKDAHDRHANIEVGYLLQRLEQFPGVVILASNLGKHLDEAFLRRLQIIVEFPPPDLDERRRIWAGVWPAAAPLAPSLDPADLARRFEITGGHIRNIAVGAAFAAAEQGAAIDLRHVLDAARAEYARMSKLVKGALFEHAGP